MVSAITSKLVRLRLKFLAAVTITSQFALQAMSSVSLRIGTIILIAIPVAELVVGLDLITTVAVFAPGALTIVAVVLVVIYLYRRRRRQRRNRSSQSETLETAGDLR